MNPLLVLLSLSVITCVAAQNASLEEVPLLSFSMPYKNKFTHLLDTLTADRNVSIGAACRQSLVLFADDLRENRLDSLLMLDSFSKLNPGFMSYQFTDFGHYKQCLIRTKQPTRFVVLEVHVNTNETQFYLGAVGERHYLVHKPLVAICIPGACSESDLSVVLKSEVVPSLIHPYELRIFTSENPGEYQFADLTVLRYFSRSILLAIVTMSLVSTFLIKFDPAEYSKHRIISCFDLVNNTREIFETKHNQSGTQFFDGIKALYLFNSMNGHLLLPMGGLTLFLEHSILRASSRIEHLIQLSYPAYSLLVIYTLVSSSVNVISWKREFTTENRVTYLNYITSRLTRIYPVLITCLLIIGSLPWYPALAGPMMVYSQKKLLNLLLSNWWKQITLLSNLFSLEIPEMVLPVAWYTSSDTQLYAVSFLVVYFMYKKPKLGVALAILMSLVGCVFHWWYLVTKSASPVLYFLRKKFHLMGPASTVVYLHTLNYIPAYTIGILLGFVIAHRIIVSERYIKIIFRMSLLLVIVMLAMVALVYDSEGAFYFSRRLELLFGVLYRPILALGLSGLYYAWWLSPSSTASKFLSCRFFAISSRMFYSIYYVHPFQYVFYHATNSSGHFRSSDTSTYFLYTLIIGFFFGYLMYVFVESPFDQLRKKFLKSAAAGKNNEISLKTEKSI